MNKLILSSACCLIFSSVLLAYPAQTAPPVVGEVNKLVTFTTKDGKKYENATVSVTDTGLSVLTSDGGGSVGFDQLPDDLSIFPDFIRKQITEKRQTVVVESNQSDPLAPQADNTPNTSNLLGDKSLATGSSSLNNYLEEMLQFPDTPESVQAKAKKMEEFNSLFDQNLPPDVMTAVQFVREKIGSSNHIIVVHDQGLIVITCGTIPHIAALKDLNPEDIVETSRSSSQADYHALANVTDVSTNTQYWLSLYTTGRTPRIKSYVHNRLDLPSAESLITIPLDDENLCKRVASAFADIIKNYGGKPEPSIDAAKTLAQLTAFIQERLAKGDPRPVTFTFDDQTGDLKIVYGGYLGTNQGVGTSVNNVRSMKPDDFQWDESGDNPSKLDVGMYQEVPVQGGVVKAPTKLNCANEQDARDVAEAFTRLCTLNGWKASKY